MGAFLKTPVIHFVYGCSQVDIRVLRSHRDGSGSRCEPSPCCRRDKVLHLNVICEPTTSRINVGALRPSLSAGPDPRLLQASKYQASGWTHSSCMSRRCKVWGFRTSKSIDSFICVAMRQLTNSAGTDCQLSVNFRPLNAVYAKRPERSGHI